MLTLDFHPAHNHTHSLGPGDPTSTPAHNHTHSLGPGDPWYQEYSGEPRHTGQLSVLYLWWHEQSGESLPWYLWLWTPTPTPTPTHNHTHSLGPGDPWYQEYSGEPPDIQGNCQYCPFDDMNKVENLFPDTCDFGPPPPPTITHTALVLGIHGSRSIQENPQTYRAIVSTVPLMTWTKWRISSLIPVTLDPHPHPQSHTQPWSWGPMVPGVFRRTKACRAIVSTAPLMTWTKWRISVVSLHNHQWMW